ncbi:phage tail protein [Granulicella cerasi]|uniref:Phage tail protein n=1 Tax=Granulicella cerasi TaxID=741063 RepID=A0ABW1ZD10_9BACT|nr:phage tail protein [Granulicella cerasi]
MPTNPEFPTTPLPYNPYRNFKFLLQCEGRYVAGVSRVSGLTRETEVEPHAAGTVKLATGQSSYATIALERGVTHDAEFAQWANKVWDYKNTSAAGQATSLAEFRKDLVLEVYNEAGQKVLAYDLFHCWPSEFTALPELDGMANAVVIQRLVLQNEGWKLYTAAAG